MAEVATRSSKRADLSGDQKKSSDTFDVRSWQGLTEVLRVAREGLKPDAYAVFRDTVLQYAQSGGDPELKKRIDAVLAHLPTGKNRSKQQIPPQEARVEIKQPKQEPVQKQKEEQQPTSSQLRGITRPRPAFTVHAHPKPAVPDPAQTKPSPAPVVQTPVPAQSVAGQPVAPATPAQKGSSAKPAVSPPQQVPPLTPPASESPSTQADTATVHTQVKSLAEYKARIAEIKHNVNTQVGNPVTLIDAGNASGREYMSALLEAMKATSGGTPGTLPVAMKRLETAYETILKSAPQAGAVSMQPQPEPQPQPTTPVPAPAPLAPAPKQPTASEPAPNVVDQEVHFAPQSIPTSVPAPSTPPAPEPPAAQASAQPVASIPSVSTPPSAPQGLTPTPHPMEVVPPDPAHVSKMRAADALLGADPAAVASRQTVDQYDLNGELVTNGLQKLLEEWNIFGSSGLLGRGPGGIEHPLYKQIGPLAMGVVTSGRFQNAKPDVVTSIQDYVNAWRHEQGISYTPVETFDHYLRRVVRRILKRQNGLSDA